jgi:lipopolysaccharide transport system ATP-binding protein
MSVAIRFEEVSKLYRLGEVGTGTLSHDLQRAWARFRGKPDPFAKVGVVNDRERESADGEDYAWALKDVSLDIQQGEIVGIIGRNGAGKSTLLKLLSRVTAPTSGRILTKGRIASLLEVGTGFHPELTGRENIYLNGAILGMRKHEIDRKLEEIVEFSGCAKYIDTPVKRYSSGMTVRLGFAVAAHLDCEILVVDEVLAVGDAEFQKKCMGRMQHMQGDGRTVLFVSHQMNMISSLCSRGIVLRNGQVEFDGKVEDAILDYQPSLSGRANETLLDVSSDNSSLYGDKRSRLLRVWAENNDGLSSRVFDLSDQINICFDCVLTGVAREWPNANFHVFDAIGSHVFCVAKRIAGSDKERSCLGRYRIKCRVPSNFLNTGTYTIGVAIVFIANGANAAFWVPQAISIHVREDLSLTLNKDRCGYAGPIPGPIRPNLDWSISLISGTDDFGPTKTNTGILIN